MKYKLTPELNQGYFIDEKFLRKRIGRGAYGVSRWIQFCFFMLDRCYVVSLYEARSTRSKYVTVHGINDTFYKVRFSNHKPNRTRELKKDCDFFVGVTHTGVRTWEDAIDACLEYFDAEPRIAPEQLGLFSDISPKDGVGVLNQMLNPIRGKHVGFRG